MRWIISGALLGTGILLWSIPTGGIPISGLILCAVLTTLFLKLRNYVSKPVHVAAGVLLVINGLGTAFASQTLSGIRIDSYAHIIAGYLTMYYLAEYFLAIKRQHALRDAALIIFILGVGVEVMQTFIQMATGKFAAECLNSFCPFYEDVVKDIINDTLGIVVHWLSVLPKVKK